MIFPPFTFLAVCLLWTFYHVNQSELKINTPVYLFHCNILFWVTLKLGSYHNNIACICPSICMCSLKVTEKDEAQTQYDGNTCLLFQLWTQSSLFLHHLLSRCCTNPASLSPTVNLTLIPPFSPSDRFSNNTVSGWV